VLVTGGGTGLGRAIAERFAAEGAAVSILGRRADVLDATARSIAGGGGTVGARVADVRVAGQVREAVEHAVREFGPVQVLVNNAGIGVESPFLELTEEAWDSVFATNVKGPFILSQLVAGQMVNEGGGVILHNGSIDAHGGERWHAPYNASKAALIGLTRTMALELAEHAIRVNAVSPG
jgi:NAD(P)-dependent dehydrogenase (short-subunit alcohol dehydrogenase family)